MELYVLEILDVHKLLRCTYNMKKGFIVLSFHIRIKPDAFTGVRATLLYRVTKKVPGQVLVCGIETSEGSE